MNDCIIIYQKKVILVIILQIPPNIEDLKTLTYKPLNRDYITVISFTI
jgi:hypothetical protein